MTREEMKLKSRFCATTVCVVAAALLVAGCEEQSAVEPGGPMKAVTDVVVLPPIESPADGLPATLPPDLEWLTNDEDPVFASTDAKRGGTFRGYMLSFPLTIRRVGPDSNGSFAGPLRYNQLSPVSIHPNTRQPIPSLASHWAFGEDGRSIFYRLNPKARWSDGVPVTADDYVFAVQFMRSKEIVAPWYNEYYTERIRDVKRYDDHVFGIQGADPKPVSEMHYQYAFGPVPKHFHEPRMSADWVTATNWEIEPNTGPYQITKIDKGKVIEMGRKADWWANDERYMANRFNPDKIRYRVIRDMSVAYQHFVNGELDSFGLVLPQYWHDKAKGELFDNGYIGRYWLYNDLPVPSAGMYLNTADPLLADERVRFGLAHAMNFDRVIDTVLRGDYDRMPTFQLGFGDYDNRSIRPRAFDIDKANAYFDEAGFNERDADGIRLRDGVPLSLRVTYGQTHHTERLVILKEEARKAGVNLELQLLDPSSAFKSMQEKKHQIAWMTWSSQGLTPRYWEHFHSANANKPQTNNLANHSNPEMDELIMTYRASVDRDERIALAHRLEQMVHDSGVVIPTFQVPYTREAAWRWVKLPEGLGTKTTGGLFNPHQLSAGAFSSGGLFWIDQDEKERTTEAMDDGTALGAITVINEEYRASMEPETG